MSRLVLVWLLCCWGLIPVQQASAQSSDLSFGSATIPDQAYAISFIPPRGNIPPLTLPEATGGTGMRTYTLSPALPPGLSFDGGTRMLSGTLAEELDEPTEYIYRVEDADGNSAELTFMIDVADIFFGNGNVTIGDVEEDNVDDEASGVLRLTASRTNVSTDLIPQTNVDGTYGTFSITADGNWTYILDNTRPVVQTLRQSKTEIDTFIVEAEFSRLLTATITIDVVGANDAPTMVSIDAPENGAIVAGGATIPVRGSGEDIDVGDSLFYRWNTTPPFMGSFAARTGIDTDPDTTWTAPAVSTNTNITLTLTVSDGPSEVSDSVTVMTVVVPSFDGETIDDQLYTIDRPVPTITLPAATGGTEPLSYDLSPALPLGVSFDEATRVISGDVGRSATTGAVPYTYTVTDFHTLTDTLTFTITVSSFPAFGTTPFAGIDTNFETGERVNLTLPAATGGSGILSYDITSARPAGLSFADRVLSGSPSKAQPATEYEYQVTDERGASTTTRFDITITDPDTAPSFGAATLDDRLYLVNEEITPVTLPSATAGNPPLDYSITPALPTGLSFNPDPEIRVLSGTPTELQNATDYTYRVVDDDTNTEDTDAAELIFSIAVVQITINGRNNFVLNENQIFNAAFRSLLTINNPFPADSTAFVPQPETRGIYGTFEITAGGSFGYELDNTDPDTDALTVGDAPTETFTVVAELRSSVTNELRSSVTQEITVTINGANDAPEVTLSAPADGDAVASAATITVTGTGEDVDTGDTLSYQWRTTPPDEGSFASATAAGTTWTAPTVSGDTAITLALSATDNSGTANDTGDASASVTVIAPGVERVTISGNATGSITEDAIPNTVSNSLSINNPNPGGPTDFISQTDVDGIYGTFRITPAGAWTYTLDNTDTATNALSANVTRPDTFTVVATASATVTQDVTITVTGVNDAPTAIIDAPGDNTEVGTGETLSLRGRAEDVDTGDNLNNLRFRWSTIPANQGSFANATFAQTTWTAPITIGAFITLVLTVTDLFGDSNTAMVTGIAVLGAPVSFSGTDMGTVTEDGTNPATGMLSISTESVNKNFVPQTDTAGTYGSFSIIEDSGVWTYALNNALPATQALAEGDAPTETFPVAAFTNPSRTRDVTITVNGVNDAPTVTISAPVANMQVAPRASVTLAADAADVDTGDILSYAWSATANAGSFANAAAEDTTWTAPAATGNVTLTLTVTDDSATASDTAVATVAVEVVTTPVNIGGELTGNVTEDATGNIVTGMATIDTALTNKDFVPQTDVAGTYGTFSISANGNWTYTLNNSLTQALAEGDAPTDTFVVMAEVRPSVTRDVTITVTGANDAPTVTIDAPAANMRVAPGAMVTLTATAADADTGDILSYAWSTTASAGSFANATAEDTTWTVPATTGNVTLTLTVTDDSGAANDTATAAVTITVVAAPLDLNRDGVIQAQDAQILYYLLLPTLAPADRTALLERLRGPASIDPASILLQVPGLDLNRNGTLDQRDAQILYYTARFETLLRDSPALLRAILGDLATEPATARDNAGRLLSPTP